jgi:hypothetical protein
MKESDYAEIYLDTKLAVNNVYRFCLTNDWDDALKAAQAGEQFCKQLQELIKLKQETK